MESQAESTDPTPKDSRDGSGRLLRSFLLLRKAGPVLVLIAVANALKLLGALSDGVSSLQKLTGAAAGDLVIGLFVLVGYIGLGLIVSRAASKQIASNARAKLVQAIILVACVGAALANARILASVSRDSVGRITAERAAARSIEKTLARLAPDGGIAFGRESRVTTPWVTSQVLVAANSVLGLQGPFILPTVQMDRIGSSIDYIVSNSSSSGSGVAWRELDSSSLPAVEPSAWSIVALIRWGPSSLRWGGANRHNKSMETAVMGVEALVSSQLQSGGWGSLMDASSLSVDQARTFPTALAVWALTEYLQSRDAADPDNRIFSARERGLSWLLDNSDGDSCGWFVNPYGVDPALCIGLSAQVLVIFKAAEVDSGVLLRRKNEYASLKSGFVKTVAACVESHGPDWCESTRAEDAIDPRTGQVAPLSRFNSWPWVYCALSALLSDGTLAGDDLDMAGTAVRHMLSQMSAAEEYVHANYSFVQAEFAHCLALAGSWPGGERE